jgi:hypothetical protein
MSVSLLRSSRLALAALALVTITSCSNTSAPTAETVASLTVFQNLVAGEIPLQSKLTGVARFADGATHTITLTRDSSGDIAYTDSRVSTPLASQLRITGADFYLQGLNGPYAPTSTLPPTNAADATTTETTVAPAPTPSDADPRGPWLNGADATSYLPGATAASAPTLEWLVEELLASTLSVKLQTCSTDIALTANPTKLSCRNGEVTASQTGDVVTVSDGLSTVTLEQDTTDVTAPDGVLSPADAAVFLASRNDTTNAIAATTAARNFAAAHRLFAASLKLELNDPALLDAHLKSKESYLDIAARDLLPAHQRVLVLTDAGWVRLCSNGCDATEPMKLITPLCFAVHQNRATVFSSFPAELTMNDVSPVSSNPAIGCPASPPTAPTATSYRDLGVATPASDPSW